MITLNLLPPEHRRELRVEQTLHRWRQSLWLLAVASLLSLGGLQVGQMLLDRDSLDTASQLQSVQKQLDRSEGGTIRRTIADLNTTSGLLSSILPQTRQWSKDLSAILQPLPPNSRLTELTLTASGDVILAGSSSVRADFLTLDELIKHHPALTEVTTSSVASRHEDVPYRYTAKLKPVP